MTGSIADELPPPYDDEVPHSSVPLWWNVARRLSEDEEGVLDAPDGGRRAGLGVVVAGLLLLAGCGGSEPPPLKPMAPEVPADLCSTIPDGAKAGLVSNSNTDTLRQPDRRLLAALPRRVARGRSGRW